MVDISLNYVDTSKCN